MADIIKFPQSEEALDEELDLDALDREGLLACLEEVRAQIRELDRREPKNMNSEAYEAWGDLHEELEDLADEIMDRLDDLG